MLFWKNIVAFLSFEHNDRIMVCLKPLSCCIIVLDSARSLVAIYVYVDVI